MKQKIFLFLCIIILSISCSSIPNILTGEPPSVNPSRIFANKEKSPEKTATLVVIRDKGFASSGCYGALYINDELSCIIALGEKATFYLEPGKYTLKFGYDPQGKGPCNCPYAASTEVTFFPGSLYKTFYLRILDTDVLNIRPKQ